uniref:DnaJ homolog subfamily B member 12 n=1 Tax=Tetraselmis sp. GSL018 TaxID=582737 RepID=A0A061S2H6_9CHLO|eukprot:CAMPEP_0177608534 /NCGR_PEP_ID=MMETSP0419_2-20121207/18526_1 /TAXON_ID=582737 /ORGANISM="Tetraselmis sp., Strain GSL018" /LENGTH=386 /DNA_ID=CAMNT_0019103237 /DNA_START=184 /DNA_END=1344 /DNA_ORIENTATION=-
MDQANKDEAQKCVSIAKGALEAGNASKARRFAEKAMKLFPMDEARIILRKLEAQSATSPSAGASSESGGGPSATAHSDSDPRPSAAGLRQRAARQKPEEEPEPEDVTQDQRDLVNKIRAAKDYYGILGISRTATDDDIKKAYRKLALKLHPDKNRARGSDEAFKAVSKAFSCLSDAEKRAAYDRYGHEDGAMAARQAAGAARGGMYRTEEDFDPEEIFNMFFGGGFGQFGQTRMYRAHFGGFPQQRARQQQQQQQQVQPNPIAGLLQLLPVLLILLLTFFNGSNEPVYSLEKTSQFPDQLTTAPHGIPYYVKLGQFKKEYPKGSQNRANVEAHVERAFKAHLEERCYQERLQQQRIKRWDPKRAKEMSLPNCEEINRIWGVRYWNL